MSVRWLLFLTAWLFIVYDVDSNHQSMVSLPSSFLNNFFQEHNVFYRREDALSGEDETQGEEEIPYSHHQEEDQYKNVYFTTESSNQDVPNHLEIKRPVSPPNQPIRSKPHRQPNRQNLQKNNRPVPQQSIRQGPQRIRHGPQSNRQDPQNNPQSKINNYCRQLYHSDVQFSHHAYNSAHCLDFLGNPRYLPILSVGTLTLLGYFLFISLRKTSTSTASSFTGAPALIRGAAPISPSKSTLVKITPRPAWIHSNVYNGKPFDVNKKIPPFWTNTEDSSSVATNSLVANQEQPFVWKPDSGQLIFFDDVNGKEVRTLNQVTLENKAELGSSPNKTEKELVH